MKMQDPALRSALAAEYALGTLRGLARRRLERRAAQDPALAEDIRFWNERLAEMALQLPPHTPRLHVWQQLEAQLGSALHAQAAQQAPTPARLADSPAANDSRYGWLWKAWAVAASVLAVLAGNAWMKERDAVAAAELALSEAQSALVKQLAEAREPEPKPFVAVFAPSEGGTDMRWNVSLHPQKRVVNIACTGSKPMPLDSGAETLELWLLDARGKPRSLGLLPLHPDGRVHQITLPGSIRASGMLLTLAVSEEPAGGSPTGQPTGRVVAAFPAGRAI